MSQSNGADLAGYYQFVEENGLLRTPEIAQQWSTAVLRALGLNLDRRTKKKLANTLPEELAFDLTRKFWLLHFRDKNKPREAFLKDSRCFFKLVLYQLMLFQTGGEYSPRARF